MGIKYILLLILALFAGGSFVLIYQDIYYKILLNNVEDFDDDAMDDGAMYDVFEVAGKQYFLPINIISGIETLSLALNILGKKLEKKQNKNLKNKKTFDDFVEEAIVEAKAVIEDDLDKN